MTTRFIATGSADSPLILMHPASQLECIAVINGLASVIATGSSHSFVDEQSGMRVTFEIADPSEGVIQVAPMDFHCRLSSSALHEALEKSKNLLAALVHGERSVYHWLDETSAISLLLTGDGKW